MGLGFKLVAEEPPVDEIDLARIQIYACKMAMAGCHEEVKRHVALGQEMNYVTRRKRKLKLRVADQIELFVRKCKDEEATELGRVATFEKQLDQVLELYDGVHDKMKKHYKWIGEVDSKVKQIEANQNELKKLKAKMSSLNEQLDNFPTGIIASNTLLPEKDGFQKLNLPEKPLKTVGTEIATHLFRVVERLEELRERLQKRRKARKLIDAAIMMTKETTLAILAEYPPLPMSAYLDTLPPDMRD